MRVRVRVCVCELEMNMNLPLNQPFSVARNNTCLSAASHSRDSLADVFWCYKHCL